MSRALALGIGCSSAAGAEEVLTLVTSILAECAGQVRVVATAEKRAAHPAIVAVGKHFGAEVKGFELDGAVAEPAARRFGPLLVAKRKSAHATCAVAEILP